MYIHVHVEAQYCAFTCSKPTMSCTHVHDMLPHCHLHCACWTVCDSDSTVHVLQADAELEAVEASARVERARVASETARLREDQDRLKCEQQAQVAGRARVEELQAAVSKRAAEMEQQSKVCS